MPGGPCLRTFDARSRRPKTEEAVHETYRMLGREHELDLEREARKRHLAAALSGAKPAPAKAAARRRTRMLVIPHRLVALFR